MKKLENEYRQLMQSETPDLWSRIEAGIDAKIAAGVVEEDSEEQIEEQADTEESKEDNVETVVEFAGQKAAGKRKAGKNFWKKYSLPLVACIAAVMCVPLVLTGFIRMASGGSKSAESAMDTAAADMAAPEANYSTTTEADAPAEYYEEVVMEESVEEEAAVTESTTAETLEDCFDAEMVETESAPADEESAAYEEEKQMADNEESIVLTVINLSREIDDLAEAAAREKGTIYYVTTEEEGDCTVFVPADCMMEPAPYPDFKILVKPGNEEYDYFYVGMAE